MGQGNLDVSGTMEMHMFVDSIKDKRRVHEVV